jgi:hypothetical protein
MKKADREKQKAEDFIQKLLDGAKRIGDLPEEERPKGCVRGPD